MVHWEQVFGLKGVVETPRSHFSSTSPTSLPRLNPFPFRRFLPTKTHFQPKTKLSALQNMAQGFRIQPSTWAEVHGLEQCQTIQG
jgi:hypothetical protein